MKQTILVIDDEKDIVDLLRYNLKKEGYEVSSAGDGVTALRLAEKRPDLCILDVMMPGMDGWEVCKALRKNETTADIPVVFLTARDSEVDEVLGLELGADDFISKPVKIRTLLARVKKLLSRPARVSAGGGKGETIMVGSMTIHADNYQVGVGRETLQFPKKEFEVLLFLARHPDRVVSREVLLNEIWGRDVYVVDRTVDVHIRKIREKLGPHANLIETVKGVGYRIRKDG